MIQLTPDSNVKELTKIRHLAYQRITWDRLRRPNVYQYRKCQRAGHTSSRCNLNYRCVKCAQTHEPGKCTIKPENDKEHLKCANCGETGHPASYKGCHYLKVVAKATAEQKRAREHAKTQRINTIYNRVQPEYSFAAAAGNQRNPNYRPNMRQPTSRIPPLPTARAQPRYGETTDPEYHYSPMTAHAHSHQRTQRTEGEDHQSERYDRLENMIKNLQGTLVNAIRTSTDSLQQMITNNASRIDYLYNVFNIK